MSFFCDFFLIHLHLFLVFLNTHVEIMYKNISIDDIRKIKGAWCLLVSKSTGTRSSLHCTWTKFLQRYSNNWSYLVFINCEGWGVHIKGWFFSFNSRNICNWFKLEYFLLGWLRNCLFIWLIYIMDKLASHSIWTVSICAVFFAHLGFVEDRNICLDHHSGFTMSKWTL